MRFLSVGLLLILSLQPLFAGGIDQAALARKGVLLAEMADDRLLCVINGSVEDPASRWFLLEGHRQNRELASVSTAFVHVTDVQVSRDHRLLAATSVAEGATILEIFDLARFQRHGEWTLVGEINPFPGQVAINGWRKHRLEVSANFPLFLLAVAPHQREPFLLPDHAVYLLNPETGDVEGGRSMRERFFRELMTALRSENPATRTEAAIKIGALNQPDLTNALQASLKRERVRSVRQTIRHALSQLKEFPTKRPR